MRTLPLLVVIAALAGCASQQYEERQRADAEQDLAEALDGYAATGETRDCINPRNTSGPQIIGSQALLFRDGPRIWRSDVIGRCPSLRPLQTVITEVKTGQLCKNDLFRTIEPGTSIPSPYCRYGPFQEYKRAGD